MTPPPGADERGHDAVIRPLLAAALGTEENGDGRVYDHGKVPGADGNAGTLPNIFVVLHLERRNAPVGRGGYASRSGWRVYARCAGRTVNEARWAMKQVSDALEGVRIEVDGIRSTPIIFDSSAGIAPDDGRQSGLIELIYAI